MLSLVLQALVGCSQRRNPRITIEESLVASEIYADVSSFFALFHGAAFFAPDPILAMNRYWVKTITLGQDIVAPSLPVYLVVEVMDKKRNHLSPVSIERTTLSNSHYNVAYFTQHPDSRIVLESIIQTLQDRFGTGLVSEPPTTLTRTSSASSSEPLIDSTAASSTSHINTATDEVSTSSAQSLYPPTQSQPHSLTSDIVSGEIHTKPRLRFWRTRTLWKIKPQKLSLFDLAILARVVREEDALFCLLGNQCHSYANIIFKAVVEMYPCDIVAGGMRTEEQIYIPPNEHFPELAAQWLEMPVSKIEEAVLSVVIPKFQTSLDEEVTKIRTKAHEIQLYRARREQEKHRNWERREALKGMEERINRLLEAQEHQEDEAKRQELEDMRENVWAEQRRLKDMQDEIDALEL